MSQSVQEQAILMAMEPVIREAEDSGMWFYHKSPERGEIWASPQYLRLRHSQGRYIWGPDQWELRSPRAYMNQLKHRAREIVEEYNDMVRRLKLDQHLALSLEDGPPPEAEVGAAIEKEAKT